MFDEIVLLPIKPSGKLILFFLCVRADSDGVIEKSSANDIASNCGLDRATFWRQMNELNAMGIVNREPHGGRDFCDPFEMRVNKYTIQLQSVREKSL